MRDDLDEAFTLSVNERRAAFGKWVSSDFDGDIFFSGLILRESHTGRLRKAEDEPRRRASVKTSLFPTGRLRGHKTLILCRMGKQAREGEPASHERAFSALEVVVAGRIEPPGRLEGGDTLWIDDRTIVVGRGYRTNADGIRQLRTLLGSAVEVVEVPLPHWRGERDVMHLLSLISPVDDDLAVVYSPLIPVPFREWLLDRGYRFVEVPDGEFATMGTNVLALGPRRCVMLSGNPRTRAALEAAGAEVTGYEGREISVKGEGGPTCLTRPIQRLGRLN